MKRKILLVLSLIAGLILMPNYAGAQTQVEVEQLFKIPLSADSGILGMRVSGSKVFVVNSAGRFVRYDLETREALNGRAPAERILDFDVVLGQLIYLDGDGKVAGRIRPTWPDQSYSACRIDVSTEGLILSGGARAVFLEKNATEAFFIDDLAMVRPIDNGYLWSMQIRGQQGRWHADLYDSYGNLMHEVYEFSDEFSPSGLEVGPIGPEGELLVSAFENNVRKLSLIASNGYMFWKMDGPPRLFPRDIAFDSQGSMLVLEAKNNEVWLTRWKLTHPEG
jgi:hypothetical protein